MKILKRTLPVALASLLILNSAVPALAAETCPLPAKIDRKKVKKTE